MTFGKLSKENGGSNPINLKDTRLEKIGLLVLSQPIASQHVQDLPRGLVKLVSLYSW